MELVQAYNFIERHKKHSYRLEKPITLDETTVVELTYGFQIEHLIKVILNESTEPVEAFSLLTSVQKGKVKISYPEEVLVQEVSLIWN